MRLRHVLAGAVLPLVLCASLWLVLPLGSQATTPQGRAASLQQKIQKTRSKIGARKGTEHVLTSDIQRWSSKIDKLQGSISTLQTRESTIQADLDTRRAPAAPSRRRRKQLVDQVQRLHEVDRLGEKGAHAEAVGGGLLQRRVVRRNHHHRQ